MCEFVHCFGNYYRKMIKIKMQRMLKRLIRQLMGRRRPLDLQLRQPPRPQMLQLKGKVDSNLILNLDTEKGVKSRQK